MSAARTSTDRLSASARVQAISAIRPLESDPNMRQIMVGRRKFATVRACDIETLRLEPGMMWTSELADAIRGAVVRLQVRKAALGMLGRRGHSRTEIIERLQRKGHDRAIASRIADELVAEGWIDDAAYAQAVVRAATLKRPASKRMLMEKLRARGIDTDTARQTLTSSTTDGSEFAAALGLARTRLSAMRMLAAATAARRIAGVLARRGYDQETVHGVLIRLGLAGEE